jgi:uncharacterized protein YjbI with pentapeptide repeats
MPAPDRLAASPPHPPDLPEAGLLAALDTTTARDPQAWSGAAVSDVALRGLEDVALEGCDLANMWARGAALRRCELRGCRLTGAFLAEAHLTDVLFVDCRLDLTALTAGKLERVTFERCRMTQCDLQETGCNAVRLLACDLTEADLTDARLQRCELHRCELRGLHPVERIRGAGIELNDLIGLAPALAAALGIRLLDADEG